ncbi:hypothetical protein PIB30_088760, partial [Stylosanthes scabra]|nr:hypothetical protein [Stylosanthes scabra]
MHRLRLREALITLYVSIPPLRYEYHGVLARARTMNHHPHGRMKVLWTWLGLIKTLLESTLHCTESTFRALFETNTSFEALGVDSRNLKVDSKVDIDQILVNH